MYNKARLVSANAQSVSFKYRDYADDHCDKVMTLSNDEFLRRYLQQKQDKTSDKTSDTHHN